MGEDLQKTGRAIIHVSSPGRSENPSLSLVPPTTIDWTDKLDGKCLDLDPNTLVPIIPINVPKTVVGSGMFQNQFSFAPGSVTPNSGNDSGKQKSKASSKRSSDNASGTPSRLARRQSLLGKETERLSPGTASTPPSFDISPGVPPTPKNMVGRFFVNNVTWLSQSLTSLSSPLMLRVLRYLREFYLYTPSETQT